MQGVLRSDINQDPIVYLRVLVNFRVFEAGKLLFSRNRKHKLMIEQIRFSFLEFPIRSRPDSRFGPLVVLLKVAVLICLTPLVIPAFTLFGYALRVREASFRGDEYLPKVSNFIELTKEGAYGVRAGAPYVIGMVLLWVVVITPVGFVTLNETVIVGFTAFIFAIGFYGFPGLMTMYAAERDFNGLYSNETLDFITNESYGLGIILYAAIWAVMGVVVFLSFVTVVGVLLTAPFMLIVRNVFLGQVGQQVQTESPSVSGKPVNFHREIF